MSIKFKKQNSVQFKAGDFVIFPTDEKIKLFPDSLKKMLPESHQFFKQVSKHVRANGSDETMLKAIFFPPLSKPLQVVSIVCVGQDDNLISYDKFFGSMRFVADEDDITIYIFEEMFGEYLVNFEAFEFDMESEFKDFDAEIVIVNQRQDTTKEIDEKSLPEPSA